MYHAEQTPTLSTGAITSIRDLKLIDPACGTGNFLVIAMEMLFELHLEEARHRQLEHAEEWSAQAIIEHLFPSSLSGLDVDEQAVVIARAALTLTAQRLSTKTTFVPQKHHQQSGPKGVRVAL